LCRDERFRHLDGVGAPTTNCYPESEGSRRFVAHAAAVGVPYSLNETILLSEGLYTAV
jgi:hypothetical protein